VSSTAQLPGTLLDAHLHTVRGAADSDLQPDDLLAEARRMGLGGMNISEHDRVWERHPWQEFEAQCDGIFLSRGMEVTTDLGHIIVFGIDEYHSGIRSAARLREVCDSLGAFMHVAHPFRHYFDPVTFMRQGKKPFDMTPEEAAERMPVFALVDGIEVGNGGNTRRENVFAYRVAEALGKPMVGGSDAHSTSGIGAFTTYFPERLTSREQMLSLLHAGAVQPYEGLNTGDLRPFVPTADD
jgi:predicted metal-dependent phosphoesterase TrpH